MSIDEKSKISKQTKINKHDSPFLLNVSSRSKTKGYSISNPNRD